MRISNKKEAVSPVIAVILMVAITVVLAAVLYVMVSGLITQTESTPHVSMQATQTTNKNWTISMTGFTTEILLRDVKLVLTDESGVEKDRIDTMDTSGAEINGGNSILKFNKGTSDTELSASQNFYVNAYTAGGDTVSWCEDWVLKLIYDPTGDAVDTVTLD